MRLEQLHVIIWSWVLSFNACVCILKHMYRPVYGYGFTYLGYPRKLKCKNGCSDQSAKIFTLENFPLYSSSSMLTCPFHLFSLDHEVSPSITSSVDSCCSITITNFIELWFVNHKELKIPYLHCTVVSLFYWCLFNRWQAGWILKRLLPCGPWIYIVSKVHACYIPE